MSATSAQICSIIWISLVKIFQPYNLIHYFPDFNIFNYWYPPQNYFYHSAMLLSPLRMWSYEEKPLHIDRLHIQTITFNKGILGKDVVFFFLSYLCCLHDYKESKSFYISPMVVLCFSSQASVLEEMPRGQLILEWLLDVFIWTRRWTKIFLSFCPTSLK